MQCGVTGGVFIEMYMHAPKTLRSCVNMRIFTALTKRRMEESINKGFGALNISSKDHGYFINEYHTSSVQYGISESSNISYEDLLKLKKRDEIFLVDVREVEEIAETGKLPGSTHIPLGELKTALEELSAEEFHKKYGVPKPELNSAIVFSCKAGVRSVKAMELAIKSGFKNSRSYGGGFMEWLEKVKPSSEQK